MKLGTEFPQEWKEKSQKDKIALADILYGYAIEDIMQRISKSSFCEYLWLINENALGEDAYRKKSKVRLEFLYIESKKKSFHVEPVAGNPFGKTMINLLLKELFSEMKPTDINWQHKMKIDAERAELSLAGTYMDMQVPVTIQIDAANAINRKAKEKKRSLFMDEKKSFTYFSYTRESILAEDLFEIMRKLELISDMGCYHRVNEILKNHSISGLYIIGEFKTMKSKEPKVVTLKRLKQLSDYRDYGYMKKKWQKYAKIHCENYEEWEVIMDRVTAFISPIWTALCKDEIFFDDWMPELERFLG